MYIYIYISLKFVDRGWKSTQAHRWETFLEEGQLTKRAKIEVREHMNNL